MTNGNGSQAQKHSLEEAPTDPYQLQGLDRVVAILDLLNASNDCLSLADICHRMNLHKSTAHRALMALERTELIERVPGNRYRLGLKLYDMGNRAVEQIDLRARVNPRLRKLALQVGEVVHLGVPLKLRVVYLDKIVPIKSRVCISSRTGISNPLYSTALGKAILAYRSPQDLRRTVSLFQYTPFTSKTLTSPQQLLDSLERVRHRGYAVDDEEMEIGTRCVAAPIRDGTGRAIAAVSISGSAERLLAHRIPAIARHVIQCCEEIAASLQLGADTARSQGPSSLTENNAAVHALLQVSPDLFE